MTFLDRAPWQGRIFVDGDWRPGAGGTVPVVEPATGAELAQAGLASPDDVRDAARSAHEAQRAWAALPHPARAAVLRRAGDLFAEHAAELSGWNVREVGAVPMMAGFSLHVAAEECWAAAALPSAPQGEVLASEDDRLSFSRRLPAGVVGVISPFNVPLILSIRSVAPALALGNAVLLKPDPRTVVTGGVLIARVLAEAGLPAGLLQLVPGGADVGQAIVEDPHVRVVSFTGSTAAGRAVGATAAEHLTRAHLELGGNSALVVLEDADVAEAVEQAAWGSFFHQGQVCMTVGRHLVHESVHDEFVSRLAAKAETLVVGDPTSEGVALGPVIDAGQRDRIHALVEESERRGAKVHAGGWFDELFYRPTVLGDVPHDAPAFAEEVFGPVAAVVPFRDDDEAVAIAAASEYGLALGIVTRDVMRGLALAERIPTGIVHVNDQTVNDEANAPFGGVRASGTGARFGGATANVEAFTETRWITVRRTPPARQL
ncbi:aldehyde dehydrogenase family protein [Aeromicrobium sp. IC_218]|uniref:aldehyde dehydrogenase family protein n=1 Tax=Aeromicrobium sp. IC_218 TaxID=2545468 RepID=UPI00103A9A56|nr:aldehyde dehydrogenase family protein [Aeromicrobium sp. IC_218]TCJ00711.1 aldehyde dehydrogenase family protein [Aeromicrobium sp. IC_218]